MPWVDEAACIGCKICVNKCPVEGAVVMVGKKARIDNSICTRCGICFDVCPTNAIHSNSERPDLRGGGMGRRDGSGRGLGRGGGMGGRGMGGGWG
jgi:ferredoxin